MTAGGAVKWVLFGLHDYLLALNSGLSIRKADTLATPKTKIDIFADLDHEQPLAAIFYSFGTRSHAA